MTTPSPTIAHPNMAKDLIISHTACLKHLTHVMEIIISQTTLTRQLKL